MADLRKNRRDGDRKSKFNKYEEGGSYGRRGNRDNRSKKYEGDGNGERNYNREDRPRYKDDQGEDRDRRDRNGRGRNRRQKDGPYEPRRERIKKEEPATHDPKSFFNSKRPPGEIEKKGNAFTLSTIIRKGRSG